jgi:hypothetical protein
MQLIYLSTVFAHIVDSSVAEGLRFQYCMRHCVLSVRITRAFLRRIHIPVKHQLDRKRAHQILLDDSQPHHVACEFAVIKAPNGAHPSFA